MENNVLNEIVQIEPGGNEEIQYNYMLSIINEALAELSLDYYFLSPEYISIYSIGDFTFGTNYKQSKDVEVVIEINNKDLSELDINYLQVRGFKKTKKKRKKTTTFTIRQRLAEILKNYFGPTSKFFTHEKYCYIKSIYETGVNYKIYFVTQTKNNEFSALDILHNKIFTFNPAKHFEAITNKNKETNASYVHLVKIFRTITNSIITDENTKHIYNSYFVETILLNVPNKLFTGSLNEMLTKILNYLYNTNFTKFVTSANEPLVKDTFISVSSLDIKKYINDIWNYLKT